MAGVSNRRREWDRANGQEATSLHESCETTPATTAIPRTSVDLVLPSDTPLSVPPGEFVEVPGRGRVFVRQLPGPPDAEVLVLLHGWTATADLNWHASYNLLGRRFRVIAFDHRGHGRGIRTTDRFRLEDCADDVAAITRELGVERFIPVGYSMGGPIAKLVWRQHPELVEGLVLCATSRHFADTPRRRAMFSVLNGTSALATTSPFRALGRLSSTALSHRLESRGDPPWMVRQVLLHDWSQVVDAGRAIGQFDARHWAGDIDVPTAVVASLGDEVVPTIRQFELAHAVRGASLHTVTGGHTACTDRSGHFVTNLLVACRSVADRARSGSSGGALVDRSGRRPLSVAEQAA